jgi:hypothetical protein
MKTVKITKRQVNFLLEKISEVEASLIGLTISGKISYFLNRNKKFLGSVANHFEKDRIALLKEHIVFKDEEKTQPVIQTKDSEGNVVDNTDKKDSDFDETFTHSYVFESKEVEEEFSSKMSDLLNQIVEITLYLINIDEDIIDNTVGEHKRLDNLWNLIDLINSIK